MTIKKHKFAHGINFLIFVLVSLICKLFLSYYFVDKVVKGSSLRIYSQNVDNKHRSLKLECRARDPVELRFFNFIKFSKQPRTLKASKNESQDAFSHIVRIKLNKEWFRGNMSIVECITVGGRRVIKTWKFLKEGK